MLMVGAVFILLTQFAELQIEDVKKRRASCDLNKLQLRTTEEAAMWTIGTGWWLTSLKQSKFRLQVFLGSVLISVSGLSSFLLLFFCDLFHLQDQMWWAPQDSIVLAACAINLAALHLCCTAVWLSEGSAMISASCWRLSGDYWWRTCSAAGGANCCWTLCSRRPRRPYRQFRASGCCLFCLFVNAACQRRSAKA